MGSIIKPNTFASGETIIASDFNDNFDTIYNEFNGSISSANLATGAVTTTKLADDAVTAAKLADDAVVTANITNASVTSEKLNATVAFRGTTTQTIPDSAAASTVTTYTEVFDYGSDFVHTTGIFTAPYDGVYCLVGNAQFGNIGSSTVRMSCNIVASNGDLAVAWASPQVDTHDPGANATLITKLTAGQTAYMTVMQDFAATAMTSTSFFAGYMVARV